jgi:CHAT domain-containing protein
MVAPWFKFRRSGLKRLCWMILAGFSLILACVLHLTPAWGVSPPAPVPAEQQGREAYQVGRYQEAVGLFEQAIARYAAQNDSLGQAMTWGNLALAQQRLGNWDAANGAIANSLAYLTPAATDPNTVTLRAQALDIEGQLLLEQGRPEEALQRWEASARLYDELGNLRGQLQSQIFQSRALQALGFYRRAVSVLNELSQTLQAQPDSLVKVAGLQSLGDALRVAGDLEQSQQLLKQALGIATRLSLTEALPGLHLSMGNTLRTEGQLAAALQSYERAIAAPPATQLRARLNQLSVLRQLHRQTQAQALALELLPQMQALSPSRSNIYARIHFVEEVSQLGDGSSLTLQSLGTILAAAVQQSQTLGDRRAESYALGSLANLYEDAQQWNEAESLTRQALRQSRLIDAADISYRWQWQMGRVLKAQNRRQEAIAAYTESFEILRSLRRDLVAANPDVQFSFREGVEPVYRQLVDLLLASEPDTAEAQLQQELKQAREVMEALQVAELENFFQEACLDTTLQLDQVVDQEDQTAAVIYPIMLPDRLEVVLKLPGTEELYRSPPVMISSTDVTTTVQELQRNLQRSFTFQQVKAGGKQLYDWLVQPIRERLDQAEIKTLIFVLDGSLRSIPMAALYDGQKYLVESYAFNLVLGLEIQDPAPLPAGAALRVLAASLTEPPADYRNQFDELVFVDTELDRIADADVTATLLRDEAFTSTAFNRALSQEQYQVVHLATHGQFGADRASTFILAADGKIGIDQLSELFQPQGQITQNPIELLILSACQTATGDERDVLGIAGTTVRAGARSAIASLWSLDDESSAIFAAELYRHLGEPGVSRAEAVRLAQLALLQNPTYAHPRYWAAYILVGSWL